MHFKHPRTTKLRATVNKLDVSLSPLKSAPVNVPIRMEHLPTDVLVEIFQFVNTGDLLFGVGATCRRFRHLSFDRGIWLKVLGKHTFWEYGIGTPQIKDIRDIRTWYHQEITKKLRTREKLHRFVAEPSSDAAIDLCEEGFSATLQLLQEFHSAESLRHRFWARWFYDSLVKLTGMKKLLALDDLEKTAKTDPLALYTALIMIDGKNIVYQLLKLLDHCHLDEMLERGMNAEERVEYIMTAIKDTNLNIGGYRFLTCLFQEIASKSDFRNTQIIGLSGTAWYVVVALDEDRVICVDFLRGTAKRSLQDIKDRMDLLGVEHVQYGMTLAQILDKFQDIPVKDSKALLRFSNTANRLHYGEQYFKTLANKIYRDAGLDIASTASFFESKCVGEQLIWDSNVGCLCVLDGEPIGVILRRQVRPSGDCYKIALPPWRIITTSVEGIDSQVLKPGDIATFQQGSFVLPDCRLDFTQLGFWFSHYDVDSQRFCDPAEQA